MSPRKAGGPRGIDWAAARTEYVTGKESFSSLGTRYGVTKKAVEKHASDRGANGGVTWGELRSQHRGKTAAKAEQRAGDVQVTRLASIRSKASEAAELALDEMLKRLREGGVTRSVAFSEGAVEYLDPIADKDLIAAAKLIVAVKVEMGGDPDGVPMQLETNLDNLSLDELRKLAGGP
jgi:hypothetical protein